MQLWSKFGAVARFSLACMRSLILTTLQKLHLLFSKRSIYNGKRDRSSPEMLLFGHQYEVMAWTVVGHI